MEITRSYSGIAKGPEQTSVGEVEKEERKARAMPDRRVKRQVTDMGKLASGDA